MFRMKDESTVHKLPHANDKNPYEITGLFVCNKGTCNIPDARGHTVKTKPHVHGRLEYVVYYTKWNIRNPGVFKMRGYVCLKVRMRVFESVRACV